MSKTIWRYQPIIAKDPHYNEYLCVIRVYFNDSGLAGWSSISPENVSALLPIADTIEGLQEELQNMLDAVKNWKPAYIDDLKIGMSFERN